MRMLVAVTAIAACVSSQYRYQPYSPVRGTSGADKAALYSAALSAMSDDGMSIETSDTSGGLIVSEWECLEVMGECNDRFRLRVTVRDGGYDVAVMCSYKKSNQLAGGWEECNDRTERPAKFIERQKRIAAALSGVVAAPVQPVPDAGVADAGQGVDAQ